MNIGNTYADIPGAFEGEVFDLEKWGSYIDACVPGAKELCLADMRECMAGGYTWEKDFLPVLNAVAEHPDRCKEAVGSFLAVTDRLDERIIGVFGKTVDADIILYLGLCNGAGWVTEVGGRVTVLLGLEKILELGWGNVDDMTGLIVHELGHVYQAQYGSLSSDADNVADEMLWQLFTEGVAMVFEQNVLGNDGYYHQDKDGWKDWCDRNVRLIGRSFDSDLPTMTHENQRYFGDWVRFEGHGDTGYYLGARFVRFLLGYDGFDGVVNYGISKVRQKYNVFIRSLL